MRLEEERTLWRGLRARSFSTIKFDLKNPLGAPPSVPGRVQFYGTVLFCVPCYRGGNSES